MGDIFLIRFFVFSVVMVLISVVNRGYGVCFLSFVL